jgi:hypothetical protein
MRTDFDVLQSNLDILASVSTNDKLTTNDTTFDIHPPTYWRALYRTCYREGRTSTIEGVRRTVVGSQNVTTALLDEIQSLSSAPEERGDIMHMRVYAAVQRYRRMRTSLESCVKGLRCLASTYRDDAFTCVQLQQQIRAVEDYNTWLSLHPIVQKIIDARAQEPAEGGDDPVAVLLAPLPPPLPAPLPLRAPPASPGPSSYSSGPLSPKRGPCPALAVPAATR